MLSLQLLMFGKSIPTFLLNVLLQESSIHWQSLVWWILTKNGNFLAKREKESSTLLQLQHWEECSISTVKESELLYWTLFEGKSKLKSLKNKEPNSSLIPAMKIGWNSTNNFWTFMASMSYLMQLEEEMWQRHLFPISSLEVKLTFMENLQWSLSLWKSQLFHFKEHRYRISCYSNGMEEFQLNKSKRSKNSTRVFWKMN